MVSEKGKYVHVTEMKTCNICQKMVKEDLLRECSLCKRTACLISKGCLKFDPCESIGMRAIFCPICYDLRFIKYSTLFSTLEKEFEIRKKKLLQKIKKEALTTTWIDEIKDAFNKNINKKIEVI